MRWPIFAVVRQLYPSFSRPYRLLETDWTSDGPRTRVVDGTFESEDDAIRELQRRETLARKEFDHA
jgi:hypothetical protein